MHQKMYSKTHIVFSIYQKRHAHQKEQNKTAIINFLTNKTEINILLFLNMLKH